MVNPNSSNEELGQQILQALRARATVKQLKTGEFRTTCLRPERHKNSDKHPSFDFNAEKGGICRVCGFKGRLTTLAQELGIDGNAENNVRRFRTAEEAIRGLMEERKLQPETIAHFGIEADLKRQAWTYPLSSGHKRYKAFQGKAAGKKYWHERGTPNQLYGLEEVPEQTPEVLIVNGEPAVWVCWQARIPAVCGLYGEGHLPDGALDALLAKGVKTITVVPDLDEPGERAALSIFDAFLDAPAWKHLDTSDGIEFALVKLPKELGEGSDLVDLYVWCEGNDDAFRKALAELPRHPFSELQEGHDGKDDLFASLTLFHDQRGEPYAAFKIEGRRQVYSITSRPFRRWLAHKAYKKTGKMLSEQQFQQRLRVLEGQACFDGPCIPLHVRVAWHDGDIYYDLGEWRAVKITSEGWEIVEEPPILFRHFAHQQPQVEPLPGGSLDLLDGLVNLASESDRLLLKVYLVTSLVPHIPRPILAAHGAHGSGKSFLFRLLKKLLDPSALETLSAPDNPREFIQLASHHLAVYFDNLASLPTWLSDGLARLCTGEGYSKRALYTDDDDMLYALRGLGGANGINLAVSKADLLDRCLILSMERIVGEKRRQEAELLATFHEARPLILGAVFDALARAMKELPGVQRASWPRMADFARWGCAVARALGRSEGEFLRAYMGNIEEQNAEALEASPVAQALLYFMQRRQRWSGTPSELLRELNRLASQQVGIASDSRSWPKDARWLTRRLNEVRPNLQDVGLLVDTGRKLADGTRLVVLSKVGDFNAGDAGVAVHAGATPGMITASKARGAGLHAGNDADVGDAQNRHHGNTGMNGIIPPNSQKDDEEWQPL